MVEGILNNIIKCSNFLFLNFICWSSSPKSFKITSIKQKSKFSFLMQSLIMSFNGIKGFVSWFFIVSFIMSYSIIWNNLRYIEKHLLFSKGNIRGRVCRHVIENWYLNYIICKCIFLNFLRRWLHQNTAATLKLHSLLWWALCY